ncbi:MAG: AAA family ATPase [Caldilineaceae bacterium]
MEPRLIRQLTTRNYKNLRGDNSVEESRTKLDKLNIFIGPNSSGKSNLIGVLRFLGGCVSDLSDATRDRTGFDDAIFRLGGPGILDRAIASPAVVKFQFEFDSMVENRVNVLELELLVQDATKPVIINQESLQGQALQHFASDEPFFYYQSHSRRSGEGRVSVYKDGVGGGQKHPPKRSSKLVPLEVVVPVNALTLSSIPELLERSTYPPENTPVYEVRRELIETIAGWRFYNANHMNLREIRLAEPKIGPNDRFLSPDGENVALVLHNLTRDSLDFEEEINNAARTILPTTRKVRAVPSGRLSLTVEWHFADLNTPFYLSELSDGTVRMLCWATILLAPTLPSLLVIDEPEVGLHVAWLPILAEWIKSASERTQVIICTHSPDLLDHFTDSVNHAYVFNPAKADRNHYVINQLNEALVADWLAEGWQLGDLYRVGNPSVGGWPW